jgi:[protein-PII] uridylyltransferase
MALDVMSARVLTTKDGRSYDLFQLMDQQGDVVNELDGEELVRRLCMATSEERPRAPVQRKMPRRLRHFTATPEVRFTADPDQAGTVLQLRCNDQPGLLSRVAAAIYRQNVQVHNARIATFGERVEDTFLISDTDHQPLTEDAMAALGEAIRQHLEQG